MNNKIIQRKWFYDELSLLFNKKDEEDKIRIRKMQRQWNATGGLGKPFIYTNTSATFGDVISIPFSCTDKCKPYAEMDLGNIASAMQFRLNFSRTHPFLIGPATLESLLDKPVENYDYIKTGKLPFNPLLFEFTEKIPATIPHIKRSNVTLHGIYLCASPSNNPDSYVFSSFWKDNDGEIIGIDLFMNDPRSTRFHGLVSHLSRSNFDIDNGRLDKNRYKFLIDVNKNKMHISQTIQKDAALAYEMYKDTGQPVDFNKLFDLSIPLDSISHNIFVMVPNLATNLINYINAHNVTIISRELVKPEGPIIPAFPNNNQYSIITVKDETYEEPKTHHQGKILTYQLSVRGHNRRLRDGTGIIIKTSWISPYIKGPEGAPFYDARHEVTAKKIMAEKSLFAGL